LTTIYDQQGTKQHFQSYQLLETYDLQVSIYDPYMG